MLIACLCLSALLSISTMKSFAISSIPTVKDGVYTISNKASGLLMNIYAGRDFNGSKITTWQYDGTIDQRINVKYIGNGKYNLYAMCSSNGTNRVIDVYRGMNYVTLGQYIDLWEPNDPSAQQYFINKQIDGSYTFEVASLPGGLIGCVNAFSNGSQLQLQKATGIDSQKWHFNNTINQRVDPAIYSTTKPSTLIMYANKTNVLTNEQVNFNWSKATNAIRYDLKIYKDGLRTDAKWGLTTLSYNYTFPIIGTYKVYVSATNGTLYSNSNEITITVRASTNDQKFVILQSKFPNGAYWNNLSSADNADGFTRIACVYHPIGAYKVTCNSFSGYGQCWGFAYKLGYEFFKTNPKNWKTVFTLYNLHVGDIIRYNGHVIFVTGVNGNMVTYADCNSDLRCKIRWNITKQKSDFKNIEFVKTCQ